ncbi:MAG: hypothetical protein IKG66_01055 [Lachnospiraceae bacterium]|nr:hypothetical protein [Lachnospiraceae bacterium]
MKRIAISALACGFLYAVLLTVGQAVSASNSILPLITGANPVSHLLKTLAVRTAGIGLLLGLLFCLLNRDIWTGHSRKDSGDPTGAGSRTATGRRGHPALLSAGFPAPLRQALLTAVLFLAWLPCYLAYYPGIFSYDMPAQTRQAVGGIHTFTKYHPPLHTWIWSLFLRAGTKYGFQPVAAYGIVQMLLLASALAHVLVWMGRRRVNIVLRGVALVFFAGSPVIAIMSIVPAKDVYFAVVFVLFSLCVCDLTADLEAGRTKWGAKDLAFILSAVLCCLLRNNAFHAIVLCMIVTALLYRRQAVRVLLLFLLPLVLFKGIDAGLYPALGIGEGNAREMLSIPVQQIANVAADPEAEITDRQQAEIDRYFGGADIGAKYNPRFADPVKNCFETATFREDTAGFLKLWAQLLRQYPRHYIDAFLSLHLPYWYPLAETVDPYSQRAYIETGIYKCDEYTFERQSRLPDLLAWYEKVASYEALADVPVVSMLYSIALPLQLLILTAGFLFSRGRGRQIACLLPAAFLWLTFIAGPVSNFRYVFPIMLLYPLYLCMMADPGTVPG